MKKHTFKLITVLIAATVIILCSVALPAGAEIFNTEISETVTEDAMAAKPALVGVDVSEYQGNINWASAKAAGVQFAMLRMYSHIPDTPNYKLDAKFEANVAGARAQGIHLGVYFFSYARNIDDVRNEANMVVNELKKYPGVFDFPIVFDAETGDDADGFDITGFAGDACYTFCKILEENGYYAMVYANTNWLNNVIDHTKISGFSIWQAEYFSKYTGYTPTQATEIDSSDRPAIKNNNQNVFIWQYTDKGSVSGISGNVDMNVAYRDYSTIIPAGGYNGFPKQNVHNHEFVATYDAAAHYKKCSCGEIEAGSSQTHTLTLNTNETQHVYSCSCGYVNATQSGDHVFNQKHTDADFHYLKCACGYIDQSSKGAHIFGNQQFDSGVHYTECECGYKDSAPHQYGEYEYNDKEHWKKCECGYQSSVIAHIMSDNKCLLCSYHIHDENNKIEFDAETHWISCDICAEIEKVPHSIDGCTCTCGYAEHEYELTADCEYHWNICNKCGFEDEKFEHDLNGVVCIECGFYGHVYIPQTDAELHWDACMICSGIINEFEHEFIDGECECGYKDVQAPNETDTDIGDSFETDESEESDDNGTDKGDSEDDEPIEDGEETEDGENVENEESDDGCKSSFGGFGMCMVVVGIACIPILKKKKD